MLGLSHLDRSKITGIVGVDSAFTHTGVARIDATGGPDMTWCIETVSTDEVLVRYGQIASKVLEIVRKNDVVFIEGYGFATKGRIVVLAGTGEIIKFTIWRKTGMEPITVAPSQIKKFISGNHKLPKEDVKLAAYKLFGKDFPTTHEAEAHTLAVIGSVLLLPGTFVKYAYQREVIEALIKKYKIP